MVSLMAFRFPLLSLSCFDSMTIGKSSCERN